MNDIQWIDGFDGGVGQLIVGYADRSAAIFDDFLDFFIDNLLRLGIVEFGVRTEHFRFGVGGLILYDVVHCFTLADLKRVAITRN